MKYTELEPIRLLRDQRNKEVKRPLVEIRPLGDFSKFICMDLGSHNKKILDKSETPSTLFNSIEALMRNIPDGIFANLQETNQIAMRRVALIDLLFARRSLDTFNQDNSQYEKRLGSSLLLQRTKQLAQIEDRPPNLQWPDIANYHPLADPRTFMAPGLGRDQEVLLYITHGGIDSIFQSVIQRDNARISTEDLSDMKGKLREAVDSMKYLNKNRGDQHFKELDLFTGRKDSDGRIASSGSFSAWTYLVGYLLTENDSLKQRLTNPINRKYFDKDAHRYIDLLFNGEFITFKKMIAQSPRNQFEELTEANKLLSHEFNLFLLTHRGAVSKHASTELNQPSPSNPAISNSVSMIDSVRR